MFGWLHLSLSNALTVILNLGIISIATNQLIERRKRWRQQRVAAIEGASNLLAQDLIDIFELGEEINWAKILEPDSETNWNRHVFDVVAKIRERARILQLSSFEVWARGPEKNIIAETKSICDQSLERLKALDEEETQADQPGLLDELRNRIEDQLHKLAKELKRSF